MKLFDGLRNRISGNAIISRLSEKVNWRFLSSFLIIFYLIVYKFPSLGLKAELFAEAGTNFLYHAYHHSTWTNLITLDFGYLPLLQRLIALLVVKLLGIIKYYPLTIQLIAAGFTAFFVSFINLNEFRKVISSDWSRFILGIGLGCIPEYGIHTFINFVYFGLFFSLLTLFIDKDRLSVKGFFGLLILNSILMCSKPPFIVFIPVNAVFLFWYIRKKSIREILYNSIVILSGSIQVLILILNRNSTAKALNSTHLDPKDLFLKIITELPRLFNGTYLSIIFKKNFPETFLGYNWNLIIGFGLIACIFILSLRRIHKNPPPVLFFVTCNVLAIGTLMLNLIALPVFQVYKNWGDYSSIPLFNWTVASMGFILIAIVTFSRLYFNRRAATALTFILVLQFTLLGFLNYRDKTGDKNISHSKWMLYYDVMKYDDYVIPLNPPPWVIIHNLVGQTSPVKNQGIRAITRTRTLKDFTITIASITAYDETNQLLAYAQRRTPILSHYEYFLFDKKIQAYRLQFLDSQGKEIDPSKLSLRYFVRKK